MGYRIKENKSRIDRAFKELTAGSQSFNVRVKFSSQSAKPLHSCRHADKGRGSYKEACFIGTRVSKAPMRQKLVYGGTRGFLSTIERRKCISSRDQKTRKNLATLIVGVNDYENLFL